MGGPTSMWTSFACAVSLLALAPSQSGSLKLSNARFTFGLLGMERTDTKVQAGDVLYLAFDIENAKVNEKTGKVRYDMLFELIDSKGKLFYSRDSTNQEVLNAFKSNRQPALANVVIGRDQKPGKYTVQVTVTDKIAKKKAVLKRDFQVVKKAFGIVQFQSPAVSFVGLPLVVQGFLEGF